MNSLDLIILVVVVFCTLLSLYWGFIRQVLALAGLAVGILLARRYYENMGTLVASVVEDNAELANLIGYLLIVFGVSLVVSLIASVLRIFVGLLFLGWLDHLLGGLLGLVQGLTVASLLLAVASGLPRAGLVGQVEGSTLRPLFQLPVRLVLHLLPKQFELPTIEMFR